MNRRPKRALAGGTIAAAAMTVLLAGCHGKTAADFVSEGDQAVAAQKFDAAEGNYKQAVEMAPTDPRPHIALGNLYVVEHKPAQAQPEFMKVIELDPKNAAAHVALGNVYADQGQFGPAESQLRAAIAIDPTRSAYHSDLGEILAKEGKPADGETELRTAIGLDPKNAQAHFRLGNLLASQPARQGEANAEYQQAKALDPKLVPPAPAATPATAAGAAPGATAKVKPVNKVFLLTHNSPMYAEPDSGSAVVGQVRHKKYVHVIGITGTWLQIKLRNGTVGFIPISAAE